MQQDIGVFVLSKNCLKSLNGDKVVQMDRLTALGYLGCLYRRSIHRTSAFGRRLRMYKLQDHCQQRLFYRTYAWMRARVILFWNE